MDFILSEYYVNLIALHPFFELAVIVVFALTVTCIMKLLRQPVILWYIVTGILVSPRVFNILQHTESIEMFSHIGVALLLFMVGLWLNPKTIKELWMSSVMIWVWQVVITALLGMLISRMLWFDMMTSLIVGLCLAFSSTIIIIKLLSDRKWLDQVHGRITIGVLIVQDLIAMIVLMIVASLPTWWAEIARWSFLWVLSIKIVWLGLFVRLMAQHALPRLTKYVADNQEMLLLFALALCFMFAGITQWLGFSMEIWALLAGLTLASWSYRFEIMTKLKPIRDFFIVLFFVFLGSQTDLTTLGSIIVPVIVLSLFVLIIKPMIVIAVMWLMWYKKHLGLTVWLTLAQVSEFSFILIGIASTMWLISNDMVLWLVTIVGLVTITGSSYYADLIEHIYRIVGRYLTIFERTKSSSDKPAMSQHPKYSTIVFGNHRTGASIISKLDQQHKNYLIIDYDPIVIKQLEASGQPCMYGDANDVLTYDELDLSAVTMVISTVHNYDSSMTMLRQIKTLAPDAVTILSAHYVSEAVSLYEAWADYVVIPHMIGGEHTAMLIEEYDCDIDKYISHKANHLALLQARK